MLGRIFGRRRREDLAGRVDDLEQTVSQQADVIKGQDLRLSSAFEVIQTHNDRIEELQKLTVQMQKDYLKILGR